VGAEAQIQPLACVSNQDMSVLCAVGLGFSAKVVMHAQRLTQNFSRLPEMNSIRDHEAEFLPPNKPRELPNEAASNNEQQRASESLPFPDYD